MPQTLDHLEPARPESGRIIRSQVFELPVDSALLDSVLGSERTIQFYRAVPVVASLAIKNRELSPHDFLSHHHVEDYKRHTGWQTPGLDTMQDTADYWRAAVLLAQTTGAMLGHLFQNAKFHDPSELHSLAVMMEHKRTHANPTTAPLENNFKPVFSGTSDFERNVPPSDFGTHLDLVHDAPVVVGFATRGGGTIARVGEYPALDPMSSQEALNAAGSTLEAVQLPDGSLHYGDARTLLHEAPSTASLTDWRDHIRFYVAPRYPNQSLN